MERIKLLSALILIGMLLSGSSSRNEYPFNDPTLSLEQRLDDLISRLTLEEKISQMGSYSAPLGRLGIKGYRWSGEALHGVVGGQAHKTTVFPQSIGLASTWNPGLVRKEAIAISDEARALATKLQNRMFLSFWSPMINMARDPRWGRTQEGYGEDPFLVSSISLEFVKGLQGDDEKYFKVLAGPKHFIANNVDWLRHFGSSDIDEKVLRDYYLPAFKKCVTQGHAQTIMSAYNALNGVPCICNEILLQDILRDEWGFDGHVVSDCGGVYNIHANHKYVETAEEAAALSVKAGTDLNCGSEYGRSLKSATDKGLIDEETIDIAVRRLFKARFELGMFDPPELVPYSEISPDVIDCDEHRELARQVARESIVLLKNDSKPGQENGFLPLSKEIRSLAVIGPNADVCQFGNYTGVPSYCTTPLEAIKTMVNGTTQVKYAQGAPLHDNNLPSIPSECLLHPSAREGEHGLKGEYFNNMNFEGTPVLTRIDSSLDMPWWNEKLFPDSVVNTDHFSVRWTGKIVPDKSQKYMISARNTVMSSGDDLGIRIYLDGEIILDQWTDHRVWETTITKKLTAGKAYDFRVEYIEDIDWAAVTIGWKAIGKDLLGEALEIAGSSDAVIIVAGTNVAWEGEHCDRRNMELPQEQQELIRKVFAANPNSCLTLVNGSPLAINWEKENIPAIIEAWFPGEEGGNAIAEVLFGDYNPGGKLPVTFYTGNEQLPDFEDYDVTKGRTYMYLKEKPLFPFGFGLSYTRFEVSNESIEKKTLSGDDIIRVSFDLENRGGMKGSEVVQLYVHEQTESKYTPVRVLKAFERIELDAKEKRRVTLSVPLVELATYNLGEKAFVTSKGTYDLMVGNSSDHFYFRDEIVIE